MNISLSLELDSTLKPYIIHCSEECWLILSHTCCEPLKKKLVNFIENQDYWVKAMRKLNTFVFHIKKQFLKTGMFKDKRSYFPKGIIYWWFLWIADLTDRGFQWETFRCWMFLVNHSKYELYSGNLWWLETSRTKTLT